MGVRVLTFRVLTAYAAVVLLIGVAIERANQAAVRDSIDPAIRAVDGQVRQLDESND